MGDELRNANKYKCLKGCLLETPVTLRDENIRTILNIIKVSS